MVLGEIAELKTKTANLQSFMDLVEDDGEIAELTETTARKFVERVVIHEAVFETGTKRKKKSQEVEIHLAYIGQFNIAKRRGFNFPRRFAFRPSRFPAAYGSFAVFFIFKEMMIWYNLIKEVLQ